MKKNSVDLPPETAGESARQRAYRAFLAEARESMHRVVAGLPVDRPLVVELGCGHGHFLVDQAMRRPEAFFLGLDVHRGRIAAGQSKARKRGLENLQFLQGDVRLFLENITEEGLTEIYALFPDPFPKARHEKHRLFQGEVLQRLMGILKPGGGLFFKTDVEPYYRQVVENLETIKELARSSREWPPSVPTVFEQRAREVFVGIWEKVTPKTGSGRAGNGWRVGLIMANPQRGGYRGP